jgi:uncharacterized protein (DUF1778 family)
MKSEQQHPARSRPRRTASRRTTLILTARETEAFAKTLLKPASPGPVLRHAARDYLRKTSVSVFTNPRS